MRLLTLIFSLIAVSIANAQMPVFSITGSIHDSLSDEPLEYATFILHSARDSSQVTGIAAGANGIFKLDSLKPGRYFGRVSFLGYDLKTVSEITLNRDNKSVDLGKILLAPSTLTGDEVVVEGERMQVEYHVEKKVINVAKQNIIPNGTATDVLSNAPAVSVDIEGNVKLRGSSNFTVMIDGRPSILDANDALQQIPAATIDKIEIITNPSSRYSAEGTAGIINVVLLRRGTDNISGLVNVRSSTNERRGVDFSLLRPVGKVSLTVSGNLGLNHDPGESRSETRTTIDNSTTTLISDGSSSRNRDFGGLRAELDVPVGTQNNLTFGGRFGMHAFGGTSDLVHTETNDVERYELHTISRNSSDREHNFISGYAGWTHRFKQEEHKWTADFNFGRRAGDETSTNETFDTNGTIIGGLKTAEDGPGMRTEFKSDYIRPVSKSGKFESGVSVRTGGFEDNNSHSDLSLDSGDYVENEQFSNSTKFSLFQPAGYTQFSNTVGKFEYQTGLRGEYLSRKIEQVKTHEEFKLDRFDLYPSAHTSYALGGHKQLMASYTRRVEHARPWSLEPFLSWESAYSVRQGNPELKPEFIDSYELGYQTEILKQFTSLEGFYRVQHNKVEWYRSVYAENVTLTRPENVGREFSLGAELRTDVSWIRGWTTTLTGSLYDQRVKGDFADRSFDEHEFSYSAKINNITALDRDTKLQIDAQYNGPELTSQGTSEPSFICNAGLRRDFFDKKINAALQVRDIFGSGKRESTSESPGLYSYEYFSMDAPVFTLSLGYSFNNFKKQRNNRGEESMDDF